MTATVTVTDNTVRADDIFLKLDALAQGYDEILAAAKQQLEEFAPSEDDWSRLYQRVVCAIDYYDCSALLRSRLVNGLEAVRRDPSLLEQSFADDPDARFAVLLLRHLETLLKDAIQRYLVSDAIRHEMEDMRRELRSWLEEAVTSAVSEEARNLANQRFLEAEAQNRCMRQLLQDCFGDQLKSLVQDAVNDANS